MKFALGVAERLTCVKNIYLRIQHRSDPSSSGFLIFLCDELLPIVEGMNAIF